MPRFFNKGQLKSQSKKGRSPKNKSKNNIEKEQSSVDSIPGLSKLGSKMLERKLQKEIVKADNSRSLHGIRYCFQCHNLWLPRRAHSVIIKNPIHTDIEHVEVKPDNVKVVRVIGIKEKNKGPKK